MQSSSLQISSSILEDVVQPSPFNWIPESRDGDHIGNSSKQLYQWLSVSNFYQTKSSDVLQGMKDMKAGDTD